MTKQDDILNSWKEIAGYVDRGVRTIQRWEKFGFPIHRASGKLKGSVYALRPEIDDWLKKGPVINVNDSIAGSVLHDIFEARRQRLSVGVATLKGAFSRFQRTQSDLQETLRRTQELRGRLRIMKNAS